MSESLVVLTFAFILDYLFGDPGYPFHPVRLMGHLITQTENGLQFIRFFNVWSGGLLTVITVGICLIYIVAVDRLLGPYNIVFRVFIVYSMLAGRDLIIHAESVYRYLKPGDIKRARRSVSYIVGRETENLDACQISKATIESVAENFTDGVLSPLFWYVAGAITGLLLKQDSTFWGLSFMVVFKVISTLDSMIGYKNQRYYHFGKIAAKLDDGFNFIPARLSIGLITISALLTKMNYIKSWQIGWRDRLQHTSPNAGHSESSVAGALDIKLGGAVKYSYGLVEKPVMGDGTDQVVCEDILKANRLVLVACWVSFAFLAGWLAIVNHLQY